MSLINDMLRDLEARRAGELDKPDLQKEIRVLPERRSGVPLRERRGLLALAGLVLAAVAGAGVWWTFGFGLKREAATPAPVAAVQAPPPAPAPPPVEPALVPPPDVQAPVNGKPAPVVPAGVAPAPTQAPVPVAPAPAPNAGPVGKPLPAVKPSPGKPLPPKVPPPKAAKVPPPPATPVAPRSPAPVSVSPEAASGAKGSIEKTLVQGTPRERAEAEYKRAQSLVAAGSPGAAVQEALQSALRQDSGFTSARQMLLKLLLDSRRYEEAMGVLHEGLEIHPAQIGWAVSLARLQVERGDAAGAERTLARSQAHGMANPEYVGFHGYLLNRLGRHREAAEKYQAAARVAPSEGRWWFGLGQALEGEGRATDAKGAFRRAVEAGNLSGEMTTLAEQKAR